MYQTLINRERHGDFLGGTVQVIPHVTDEIKTRMHRLAQKSQADIIITEIGGTIGDIESQPFIEAIRQFKKDVGSANVCYIHVSLLPYIAASHEVKTKPTQHSVKELRSLGVSPDIIVCRADHEVDQGLLRKIALFCDVDEDAVFVNTDCPSIYDVPILLSQQGLDLKVCEILGLDPRTSDMSSWNSFLEAKSKLAGNVKIKIVGKYIQLPDAYLSIIEALHHAGVARGTNVDIELIDGSKLDETNVAEALQEADGILVPGGLAYGALKAK